MGMGGRVVVCMDEKFLCLIHASVHHYFFVCKCCFVHVVCQFFKLFFILSS